MARDISSLSSVVRAKDIVRIGVAGDISPNILIYLYTHCRPNEYNKALAKQFFL